MAVRHIATAMVVLSVATQVGAETVEFKDNVSLNGYLELLEQITPAARAGAEAYLRTYRGRCGHDLPTVELRRLMSAGDSVVLKMVQSAHYGQPDLQRTAEQQLMCRPLAVRR